MNDLYCGCTETQVSIMYGRKGMCLSCGMRMEEADDRDDRHGLADDAPGEQREHSRQHQHRNEGRLQRWYLAC